MMLLLPRRCPGCGGDEGRWGAGLCASCRTQIGHRLHRVVVPDSLHAGWALQTYAGQMSTLIRRAKFKPCPALADAIGGWMAGAVGSLPPVDWVVPVRAHWWRVLRRGQDLPERLGGPVAAALGVPMVRALRRVHGGTQVGRSQADRRELSLQAFAVTRPVSGRVLLLDDVLTTGSTAGICAEVLRAAGATWVGLLCAAHRPWQDVKKS